MSLASAILLLVVECAVLAWLVFHFLSGVVSVLYGAPYVPIENYRLHKLLVFGGVGPGDVLYDLGSGDGRVMIAATRDLGAAEAVGYEIAPWPYWKSRWHIARLGLTNVTIHHQSFFDGDFSPATCVYAYLYPKLVDRIANKLARELAPGTRVICPSFLIDTNRHPEFRLKKEEKIGRLTAYLYEKI